MGRKHCGKRENCSLRAIFPFPTMFSKGLFPRGIKGVIVWEWGREGNAINLDLTLSQTTNLDSSKLRKFADDSFKFGENGRKFSKWVENTVGKGEIAHYEQFRLFSQSFKRLVLQTHKKTRACLGKGYAFTCNVFYPYMSQIFNK